MENSSPRRLTVADGMALLGATAVGFAAARRAPMAEMSVPLTVPWDVAFVTGSYLGLSWTAALLVLSLRRPRLGRRELFRRPGAAACIAIVLAAAWGGISVACEVASEAQVNPGWGVRLVPFNAWNLIADACAAVGPGAALAVTAVWTVMALGGRWEPDRSWTDRAGRLLGAYWVGMGLSYHVLVHFV
jgi:hypothetical protein